MIVTGAEIGLGKEIVVTEVVTATGIGTETETEAIGTATGIGTETVIVAEEAHGTIDPDRSRKARNVAGVRTATVRAA